MLQVTLHLYNQLNGWYLYSLVMVSISRDSGEEGEFTLASTIHTRSTALRISLTSVSIIRTRPDLLLIEIASCTLSATILNLQRCTKPCTTIISRRPAEIKSLRKSSYLTSSTNLGSCIEERVKAGALPLPWLTAIDTSAVTAATYFVQLIDGGGTLQPFRARFVRNITSSTDETFGHVRC